jgi:hypothetical protein
LTPVSRQANIWSAGNLIVFPFPFPFPFAFAFAFGFPFPVLLPPRSSSSSSVSSPSGFGGPGRDFPLAVVAVVVIAVVPVLAGEALVPLGGIGGGSVPVDVFSLDSSLGFGTSTHSGDQQMVPKHIDLRRHKRTIYSHSILTIGPSFL